MLAVTQFQKKQIMAAHTVDSCPSQCLLCVFVCLFLNNNFLKNVSPRLKYTIQTLTVKAEGINTLPNNRTEVNIYAIECSPSATPRRAPATRLEANFEQPNIETQLQQLCVTLSMAGAELPPTQIQQFYRLRTDLLQPPLIDTREVR